MDKGEREVRYVSKQKIEEAIERKYPNKLPLQSEAASPSAGDMNKNIISKVISSSRPKIKT